MRRFGFGLLTPTAIFIVLWVGVAYEWLVWSEPVLRYAVTIPLALYLPGFALHWKRARLTIHPTTFKVTLIRGKSPQFGYLAQGVASILFFSTLAGVFMLLIRDRM